MSESFGLLTIIDITTSRCLATRERSHSLRVTALLGNVNQTCRDAQHKSWHDPVRQSERCKSLGSAYISRAFMQLRWSYVLYAGRADTCPNPNNPMSLLKCYATKLGPFISGLTTFKVNI